MTWQFEWNWLGYLWAILIGGQLSALTGIFLGVLVSIWKAEEDPLDGKKVIDMMALSIVGSSILLGLVTIFFWGFRTALLLVIGTSLLLALVFGIAYALMRLFETRSASPEEKG